MPPVRRRHVLLFGFGLVAGLALARRVSVGDEELPPDLEAKLGRTKAGHEALLTLSDETGFEALPPPRRGDWRLGPGEDEEPQSFRAYAAGSPVRATEERSRIVLAPLGDFDDEGRQVLETMRAYGETFFGCPVAIGEALELPEAGRRRRTGGPAGDWDQWLSTEIMDRVLLPKLPDDAIVYLGITMGDLYPDPDWNFVFGQASLARRVGVYSLARYSPEFYGEERDETSSRKFLERACKVLTHETCHAFGLEHCLHYLCCMNGSNNLGETDRQPLWLCPVCLSKLAWNRGFDPAERYRKLAAFFEEVGFPDLATWHRDRAAGVR